MDTPDLTLWGASGGGARRGCGRGIWIRNRLESNPLLDKQEPVNVLRKKGVGTISELIK